MKAKLDKFFRILKIELEDLEEDLTMMIEVHNERKAKGEISKYVYLENICILKEELFGLKKIVESLDNIPDNKCEGINDIVCCLDKHFKEKTKLALMPESVYSQIKKKMNKVLKYVEED